MSSPSPDSFSEPSFETEDAGQIRVVLVEDDANLRAGLVRAVCRNPALKLLADFPDAESALKKIQALAPDVVVTDLKLPGGSGIQFTAAVKRLLPATKLLVLTAFSDTDLIVSALRAGASGYLLKRHTAQELLQAIQQVWSGGAPMSPDIARKVVESFRIESSANLEAYQALTPREEEILSHLAKGHLTKEIADILEISYATVRFHLRHIYEKLHVNNRTQAVVKYFGNPSGAP